jgi:hypothetical protein
MCFFSYCNPTRLRYFQVQGEIAQLKQAETDDETIQRKLAETRKLRPCGLDAD